jgi:hypothetical protein
MLSTQNKANFGYNFFSLREPLDLVRKVGRDGVVLVKRDPLQVWVGERVRELVPKVFFP